MARYTAAANRASMDTTNGICAIWVATATQVPRFRVIDIVFGCDGTPGDTAMTLRVNRSTAAATGGTALTPQAVDIADIAARAVAMHLAMTNGTNSGTILEMACNQRATIRWFSAPGEELVSGGTNLTGLHFLTPVAPALSGRLCVIYDE
jgi:hypothetical protein